MLHNLCITFLKSSFSKIACSLIAIAVILGQSSCKQPEKKIFQKESLLSIDSAITYAKTLTQVNRISYLYQYTNKKIFSEKDRHHTPQLFAYIHTWDQQSNEANVHNMWLRLKSTYNLQQGNNDSALLYSQKALRHAQIECPENLLETYRTLSVAYYYNNQSDSAVFYWQLGYKEAVIDKDPYNTYSFANNLGTHYYNKDNLNLALKFFTLAIKASSEFNLKEPILTNNIVSTLISQQKLEKALEYWEKNRDVLVLDTNTYKGQLIYLSRINLLQLLNRNTEADSLLSYLNIECIHATLVTHYLCVLMNAKFNKNDFSLFQNPRYKPVIDKNLVFIINKLADEWIDNLENIEIKKLIPLIESNFYQLENSSPKEHKSLFQLSRVLAYHFAKSNPQKSIAYFKLASNQKKQIDKIQKLEQNRNTNELSDLEITFNEIKEKEAIIEKEELLRDVLIVSILILILIIVLTSRIYQNNLRTKTQQQKFLETQQNSLKKEQELNNRIVEYSKSIITNNRYLKQQLSLLLSQVSIPVQLQIKEIQGNLQDIVSLDSDENPALAEKIITEKEDWEQKYPGFETLNKTEKRIFVLTLENYKTKEIAHVLGVAIQYVRNVKSRLRKKIDLPENW
jgi:hypothetical protein